MMETTSMIETSRPPIRSSQGFTLIEVIATLSLLLVVAVAAAGMLGSISEIGLRYRHSQEEQMAVRRLATQFRKDFMPSTKVVSDPGDWPLRLALPSKMIEYHWDASANRVVRLVRTRESNDAPGQLTEQETLTGTEMFQLSNRCEPRLLFEKDRLLMILRESDATNWLVEAWR